MKPHTSSGGKLAASERRPWCRTWQRWLDRSRAWLHLPPRVAARRQPPPAGTPEGQAAAPGWALAWASQAGPHHLNQDCAGANWLRPTPGPALDGAAPAELAVAVADGVTNGAGGDIAALALVQHWLQAADAARDRLGFLLAAEAAVAGALRRHTSQPGAATGAACWLGAGGQGWATRVGDCRLLHARPQPPGPVIGEPSWQVQPLLPDQTYALVYPQLAASAGDANQPAHMVGCDRLGEPEWVAVELAIGELLILASDGLHSALARADWAQLLQRHIGPGARAADLQNLTRDLLLTAAALGSEDDITALAVMRLMDPSNPR